MSTSVWVCVFVSRHKRERSALKGVCAIVRGRTSDNNCGRNNATENVDLLRHQNGSCLIIAFDGVNIPDRSGY